MGSTRSYMRCLVVLMEQAVPGVVLVSDQDNGPRRQFAQGCDGQGGGVTALQDARGIAVLLHFVVGVCIPVQAVVER